MANANPVTKQASPEAPAPAADVTMPAAPAPKAKAAPAPVDASNLKDLHEAALAEGKNSILEARFVRIDN